MLKGYHIWLALAYMYVKIGVEPEIRSLITFSGVGQKYPNWIKNEENY